LRRQGRRIIESLNKYYVGQTKISKMGLNVITMGGKNTPEKEFCGD